MVPVSAASPQATSITRPMRVTLPDGSERELEDGATGADLAASIGSGLARAALAIRVRQRERRRAPRRQRLRRGPDPRPRGAAARRRARRDRHRQRDDWDSVELIRHDTAHVLAAAVLDLYPGTKISIGPPIGEGFYYDFEFPDGVTVSEHDFEALEAKMREHIKADEPFAREDVPVGRRARALQGRGPGLQGRADRGPGARPGRRDRQPLHQRRVHRPLPRPAHAVDQAREGVQAAVGRRRLLARRRRAARCSRASTAPPSTPRRTSSSTCTSSRRPARATTASLGTRPRPVHVQRAEPRLAVLAAERHGDAQRAAEPVARGERAPAATARSRRRSSTTSSCGSSPATGTCTATTCTSRTSRADPMGLKPMNCPAHVQIYKDERRSYRDLPIRYSEAGLVHRHEPSGTLHGLLRVRHITQDDAHIFCTEEQIAGRGPALPRLRLRDLRHVRLQAAAGALDPAGQARRHRGDVGPGRGGCSPRRSTTTGVEYELNAGRRRVLRPEDRPPHDRLDRPLVAARHRPARLLHARALRARPTPAPTTPTTGR